MPNLFNTLTLNLHEFAGPIFHEDSFYDANFMGGQFTNDAVKVVLTFKKTLRTNAMGDVMPF